MKTSSSAMKPAFFALSFAGLCAAAFVVGQGVLAAPKAPSGQTPAVAPSVPAPPKPQPALKTPRRVALPDKVHRTVEHVLPAQPTAADILAFPSFAEPLRPVPGEDSAAVRAALGAAMRQFAQRQATDDFSAFDGFLSAHGASVWAPGLRLNLGLIAYGAGRFSFALDQWRIAWETLREKSDPVSTSIADRAVAEYARMLARVGRKVELKPLIEATAGRTPQGAAAQVLGMAREGLWGMERHPEMAFRCGPYALMLVKHQLGGEVDAKFLDPIKSPETGFALNEVAAMAPALGLEVIASRRPAGAPVPVPCVVHWKLNHYGALVQKEGDRYLLKDPTFGSEHWITAATLDVESSGAFLVVGKSAPAGWAPISAADARLVFGKGFGTSATPNETGDCSHQSGGDGGSCPGMATYRFHTMLASLSVIDTPLSYRPAFGPSVELTVRYNQKEVDQPATMLFTNFSPQWESRWVAYLDDDPASPATTVTVHLRGGGYEENTGYDAGTSSYARNRITNAKLHRINPDLYERRFRSGAKEVYGLAIGTTAPRKVFLTQIVDPQGRALSLIYDSNPTYPTRLVQIVDASGLATDWFYDDPAAPYHVTRVRDPFGREAIFTYTTLAGTKRLTTITDVIGIQSSFRYDAAGNITHLTTPYGTTQFNFGTDTVSDRGILRYLEAVDPHGDIERLEYVVGSEVTGATATLPPGEIPSAPGFSAYNDRQHDRNTYYWDKEAWHHHPGDYSKARLYHWLQVDGAHVASGILESEKRPLQSRRWFNYPGQTLGPQNLGSAPTASAVARLKEDATGAVVTDLTAYEYNSAGNMTKMVDPVGRETVYEYAANGLDLIAVRQKNGAAYDTIEQRTYHIADPPHLPRTVTDAAGQTTTYAYNSRGQVTTVTNALGEVNNYIYEENIASPDFGQLKETIGACCGGANTSYTYDAAQRVRTVTRSDGYSLTYDYDALDRLTRVTYPDGTFEETTYTHLDATARRDREGRVTRTGYDALRRSIWTTDPLGRTLQFEWCRCGDMKTLIDARGNATRWTYDLEGRVVAKRYADNKGDDYTYEPNSGRLATITDAKGQVKTYRYHLDGTLAHIGYTNEQIETPDVAWTYDPVYRRVTSMVDGIGTTTYAYHPAGSLGALKPSAENGPFVGDDDLMRFTYDALGRLKTRDIGPNVGDNLVTWNRDGLGRVTTEVNPLGTFTYNYDGSTSRPLGIAYPNGINVTYQYWPAVTPGQPGNGDFRLKQIKNQGPTELLSQFDYTYDPSGNIMTWERRLGAAAAPHTWHMTYDAADQLTSQTVRDTANPNTILETNAWTYDPAGNRLTDQHNEEVRSSTYNNLNQLTQTTAGGTMLVQGHTDEPAQVTVNGVQASADSANRWQARIPVTPGPNNIAATATDFAQPQNTSTKQWAANVSAIPGSVSTYDYAGNTTSDDQWTNQWDGNDRLISATKGGRTFQFRYDGLGRMVTVMEFLNGQIQCDTHLSWTGSSRVRISSSIATVVEVQHCFPRGWRTESGSSFLQTFDHLSSVREVVDGLSLVVARSDYTAWGSSLSLIGSSLEYFGFTGHYKLPEVDLVIAPARVYRPSIARWTSLDPIFESDGANMFYYARNNPVRYVDYLGLTACDIPKFCGFQPYIDPSCEDGCLAAFYTCVDKEKITVGDIIENTVGSAVLGGIGGCVASGGNPAGTLSGLIGGGVSGAIGTPIGSGIMQSYCFARYAACRASCVRVEKVCELDPPEGDAPHDLGNNPYGPNAYTR